MTVSITMLGSTATGKAAAISSLNATHTLSAGDCRIAIAFVYQSYYNANELCSSVTYGGVAMTKIADVGTHTTNARNISAWYLLEANLPANGSKTVTATFGATVSTAILVVFTIQGAKQQPYETYSTYDSGTSAVSTSTINLTTVNNGAWVFSGAGIYKLATFTHGAGQTEIADLQQDGAAKTAHSCSYEEIATPAAVSQTDIADTTGWMVGIGFSFAPQPEFIPSAVII